VGTDIHCWIEKRVDDALGTIKGRWVLVHPLPTDAGFDTYINEEGRKSWYEEDQPGRWEARKAALDLGRSYDLFAMFADVRNGRGFGGIRTGDGFEPILSFEKDGVLEHARGWPEDRCEELRHEEPDHTPSWLTLQELNAYDWTGQIVKKCGVIPLAEYQRRLAAKETGSPNSYCGGIAGPNVETLDAARADELLKKGELPSGMSTHVRIEWIVTYAETVSWFYDKHLPNLNEIAKREGVGPCDLRLVFYFDS
jgi:hypothetical protein